MFELICNVLLFAGLLYTLNFNVIEAPVPAKVLRNPYALHPGLWPKAIIVLLLVLIAVNIVRMVMKNRGNPEFSLSRFLVASLSFLKSRLFVGILIVVGACFLLEPLGYMGTCFLTLFFYGMLLGERRILRLLVQSMAVTLFLYLLFSVFLSVNLPRGTLEPARNFALGVESLVSQVRGAF